MSQNNFKDKTGRRFGSLVVIERDADRIARSKDRPKGHRVVMWLCRCDCGDIVSVYGRDLTRGHSTRCQKCGQAGRRKHEVGAVVGSWTVIEAIPGDKTTGCKYRVTCVNCGSQTTRQATLGACQVCAQRKRDTARAVAKAERVAAAARRVAAMRQPDCHVCGKPVPTDGTRVKFCSERCARKNRMVARRHVYRAKAAGVPWELVDVFGVFNDAGWMCAECHTPTPRRLYGTNVPNAPELDHVIALVNGGAHARANCRCTCRRCNLRKGFAEGAIATGSRNPKAKMTTKDVTRLLGDRKSGKTIAALARKYGLHEKTVRQIVLGRAWRHVPRPDAPRAA